jgi:hypothetical protein
MSLLMFNKDNTKDPKINNKLMFSPCRLCTEINQQTPCHHNNEERAFTGTWVTDELKMAVDKG